MLNRFPLVKQHDETDCGAAALASVLRYYKCSVGLQQMRELAGTDSVGTNLLGLVRAAEKLDFVAIGAKGSYGRACVSQVAGHRSHQE